MAEKIKDFRGAIAWMAKNRVAANLLMIAFLLGGMVMISQTKQEIFPEMDMDFIIVSVPYPGASPEEVETGILKAIEEEVRGLDDIKRVSSTGRENMGSVFVELLAGANTNKLLQDVKNAVDRITSFPKDIERPIVSMMNSRQQVISIALHGQQSEAVLRKAAEDLREKLLEFDQITVVELDGARQPEISIEVSQENLRAYGLTLQQIARMISADSLEMPGGSVKTRGGEVLVRTTERKNWAREYADFPVISRNDGTVVYLKDIATIKETFQESDLSSRYNNEPAIMLNIFRVGDQTPSEVSKVAKEYIAIATKELPESLTISMWNDYSEILEDRISLLTKNAMTGLVLVLIFLGLFLDIRLAFWVTMGIPISIIGTMLFMPAMDVSINMMSLFAIIITIGIVVDDAVVVGENIFEKRQKGIPFLQAAIEGAEQMAIPVTFAILTNIAAFMPMLFLPGITGKIFKVIPTVVIFVFLISLVEALFILPAHLSHQSKMDDSGILGWLNEKRRTVSRSMAWLNRTAYQPLLKYALKLRYATVAFWMMLMFVVVGFVASGRIEFTFMPKVEADRVTASITMPFGVPLERTLEVQQLLINSGKEVLADYGGESIIRGFFSQVGSMPAAQGPVAINLGLGGGHITNAQVYMVPIDERDLTAEQLVREWNAKMEGIPGIESMTFSYSMMAPGKPISLLIGHPDHDTLRQAASDLARKLEGFAGVRDIDNGYSEGKRQLDFTLKPAGQAVGLTSVDLAMQVRASFFGAEAVRNQRGRDEVRVYVRLPKDERMSEYNIEELMIRTPAGGEIPLREAADITRGRSYTEIQRVDGRRMLTVSADVEIGLANADKVVDSILENEMPLLMEKYPGLVYMLEGQKKDMADAMSSLMTGFVLALFAIFAMLAIPFKSYAQPVIIMMSIPFGFVGAVIGHIAMGYELSIISMLGLVALAGVVVNDGLILLTRANENRWSGMTHKEAIFEAGARRFRPIILTSVTTFFGLAPMIFETSLQARFLIPMAISLGFGILFATAICLIFVPSLYLIVYDIKKLLGLKDELPIGVKIPDREIPQAVHNGTETESA
jgi:multidrug efflux pump subunit AcrB